MQTPVQFYVENITARIAKHEAIEKQNPAKLKTLREQRRDLAMKIAGVTAAQVKEIECSERYNEHSPATVCLRTSVRHVKRKIVISAKHPKLKANADAIEKLKASQRAGCTECGQLRALIDTKGTNGFVSFLRSRYGKTFTVANAKEALPDWLRLRAPAACPVLD